MKRFALAALLATAAFLPARADMLDMSTVTCTQLSEMQGDEGAWFLIWLDGWLAGQSDSTEVNIADLNAQIDGIAKVCAEKPDLSVMNAAKEYLGE